MHNRTGATIVTRGIKFHIYINTTALIWISVLIRIKSWWCFNKFRVQIRLFLYTIYKQYYFFFLTKCKSTNAHLPFEELVSTYRWWKKHWYTSKLIQLQQAWRWYSRASLFELFHHYGTMEAENDIHFY